MAQENSKGKIKILESGAELQFNIHPETFRIHKGFKYQLEHCIGEKSPLVSFCSGGARSLEVQVHFDQDVDPNFRSQQLLSFLEALEKVDPKSKSVSMTEFRLGDFSFQGYVEDYQLQPTRFDRKYQIQQAHLNLRIVESSEGKA